MAKNSDKSLSGSEVMETAKLIFVLKNYSIPLYNALMTEFNKTGKIGHQILKELNLEKVTTIVKITQYTGKSSTSSKTIYRSRKE